MRSVHCAFTKGRWNQNLPLFLRTIENSSALRYKTAVRHIRSRYFAARASSSPGLLYLHDATTSKQNEGLRMRFAFVDSTF